MDATEITRAHEALGRERDGAVLYRALAAAEKDARLADVYARMAAAEERHAAVWVARLEEARQPVPAHRTAWRTHVLAWAARRFGVPAVLPGIAAAERSDAGIYDATPGAAPLAADEHSHARLLGHLSHAGMGGLSGGALAQLEGRRHAVGGNALRAAVLGANDGLVSNLSLVMGVAGAAMQSHAILVTGLAGLLAGACAMALGEWLSVQSSRELYQRQVGLEREELANAPEEELEELALIYQARGLDEAEARRTAERILADPEAAVDTLAREELGIDSAELGGSAWEAAVTSFVLFALGAIGPVAPFAFLQGTPAVLTSLVVSAVGLFTIGAGTSLFTGRPVWFSGGRMVVFGLSAAAVTFGIGRLIGVSVGG